MRCQVKGNEYGRLFLKGFLNAIHMSNSDMADCKSFARQQNLENIDPSLLYVAYEPCDIAHKSAQFGRHRGSRTNTAAKKGVEVDQKTASLFRQNSGRLSSFFRSFLILKLRSFRGMIHLSIHRAFTA